MGQGENYSLWVQFENSSKADCFRRNLPEEIPKNKFQSPRWKDEASKDLTDFKGLQSGLSIMPSLAYTLFYFPAKPEIEVKIRQIDWSN